MSPPRSTARPSSCAIGHAPSRRSKGSWPSPTTGRRWRHGRRVVWSSSPTPGASRPRSISKGAAAAIFVVVVEEEGVLDRRPVAILPLRVWRRGGRRIVTGLSEPIQQYTELVLRPDIDPSAVWPHIRDAVRSARADYLHLGQVREGGPLHAAVGDGLDPVGAPTGGAGRRSRPVARLRDLPQDGQRQDAKESAKRPQQARSPGRARPCRRLLEADACAPSWRAPTRAAPPGWSGWA